MTICDNLRHFRTFSVPSPSSSLLDFAGTRKKERKSSRKIRERRPAAKKQKSSPKSVLPKASPKGSPSRSTFTRRGGGLKTSDGGERRFLSSLVFLSGVENPTRSSLKGVSSRALFAYKNGRFANSFLLLGIDFETLKKANMSFKSPPLKPHLNRTGSVVTLPILAGGKDIFSKYLLLSGKTLGCSRERIFSKPLPAQH